MSNNLEKDLTETNEPAEGEQTWENNDSTREVAENSNTQQQETQQPQKKEYTSKKDYRDIAEKSQKQIEWLRSVQDKRDAEYRKEMAELAPLKELWKRAEEERKSKELSGLATSNPAEYQKRLIDEAKSQLSQQFAPLQQQQDVQAVTQEANSYVNHMKTTYGEEVYKATEPIMGQILDNVRSNVGQNEARILAKNPDALMKMAVGEMYLAQYKNVQSSQQQGQQNQQRAIQFAKGTAKPNAPSQRAVNYETMSDADLKKAAYAELSRKYNS
jgi:hypothetical protein